MPRFVRYLIGAREAWCVLGFLLCLLVICLIVFFATLVDEVGVTPDDLDVGGDDDAEA